MSVCQRVHVDPSIVESVFDVFAEQLSLAGLACGT
jgi:hypothetical protein